MSGPPDGKFLIISTAIPRPSIGADNRDDCAVKAAITDGEMRVWSLRNEGGLYRLVLDDNWYASQDGDKVVVRTSVDPGTRWEIASVGDGSYLIRSGYSNEVWTVKTHGSEVVPKSQVSVEPLKSLLDNSQTFKFIRILED